MRRNIIRAAIGSALAAVVLGVIGTVVAPHRHPRTTIRQTDI
jgi:hypothetical protein